MARTNGASKIGYLFLILFIGCSSPSKESGPEGKFSVDGLKSGMLICRLGNGFFSNQFRKVASAEQKFSHIGMLSIENDSVFVYHSEASELTGIGSVKREEIHHFLRGIQTFEFFQFKYPDSITAQIVGEIKKYHTLKTPFDLEFNSSNDDKLYCTELIATSVNTILGDDEIQPKIQVKEKLIYGLDDIYLHKNVIPFSFETKTDFSEN